VQELVLQFVPTYAIVNFKKVLMVGFQKGEDEEEKAYPQK